MPLWAGMLSRKFVPKSRAYPGSPWILGAAVGIVSLVGLVPLLPVHNPLWDRTLDSLWDGSPLREIVTPNPIYSFSVIFFLSENIDSSDYM